MPDYKKLFLSLYSAQKEGDVDKVLREHERLFEWFPYGGDENNYSTFANQQENAVTALVEKITNSIDAILMKKCHEKGIDPKSQDAPRGIKEAVKEFFPLSEAWNDKNSRRKQASDIQIIADGPKGETSLVIYDDGEGQHPKDFEDTILSLIRGNKNEIPFVQGKYNMGGTGAIRFCGSSNKRYQLIASRRYDGTGDLGFTLVRRHNLTDQTRKNTWYEYFKIDGEIPTLSIDKKGIDLGLLNRKFSTGTIIKLYSYDLPSGVKSVISRDLHSSLNEYLFEPALPAYTIDIKDRYPDDRNLTRHFFGLKRKLEEDDSDYIYHRFSIDCTDRENYGKMKISVYVFNFRTNDKAPKEVKDYIKREFFKNNMSVLFSLNGQVHGHLKPEFISRSLDMPLLKDYLLIHVDCTEMVRDYADELFMGSRDRLKKGKEYEALRRALADKLKNSPLKQIYHEFKQGISLVAESHGNIIEQFSAKYKEQMENLQFLVGAMQKSGVGSNKTTNSDDDNREKSNKNQKKTNFNPQRYPSQFLINSKHLKENRGIVQIPESGSRTISFLTDVENEYFDRSNDPGDIEIGIVKRKLKNPESNPNPNPNSVHDSVSDIFNVEKSSPNEGEIKIGLKANENLVNGDEIELKFTLKSPSVDELEQHCLVKIVEKQAKPQKKTPKNKENYSLPQLVQVWKKVPDYIDNGKNWNDLSMMSWDEDKVVYLEIEDKKLSSVYINMDWYKLVQIKKQQKSEEAMKRVENKYLFSIYAHSIYLYYSNAKAKYIDFNRGDENSSEIHEYISDIFSSHYAEFVLNTSLSMLSDD